MPTVPTQIRIDSDLKTQATYLFKDLGFDLSTAVNIFLRQCVMHDGLPFNVGVSHYRPETIAAMEEAKRISRDPDVKGYTSVEELFKELEN